MYWLIAKFTADTIECSEKSENIEKKYIIKNIRQNQKKSDQLKKWRNIEKIRKNDALNLPLPGTRGGPGPIAHGPLLMAHEALGAHEAQGSHAAQGSHEAHEA